MPSSNDLCRRRCVAELIYVVEQMPARLAMRSPLKLDDTSVAMVMLWSLLRWERTFWVVCLENLGVNLWNLTCQLDALINQKKKKSGADSRRDDSVDPWSDRFRYEVDLFLNPLLDRAGQEAFAMGHNYLGCEHLLLAIIADADSPLAALLSQFQINYLDVKGAILASLPQDTATREENETIPVNENRAPWGTIWDTPATGVPRRFGLALMFLIVTLYALLFSGLKLLGAPPAVFAMIAILITSVGFGQVILFGAKYPRAASIWVGLFLFPVEILVAQLLFLLNSSNAFITDDEIAVAIVSVVLAIPGGAIFGYLAGCLTAGIFLLLDLYTKKVGSDNGPEEDVS